MAVRNFWFNATVDGQVSKKSGGPVRKDGGMTIHIKQRENGNPKTVFSIYCFVDDAGQLVTEVQNKVNGTTEHAVTQR